MEKLKKIIKSFLLSKPIIFVFGSKKLFKILFKNKIVVFLFHEISYNPSKFYYENNLNINPDLFKKQIEFIKNNFKVIHAKELYNKRTKTPTALITFDDGSICLFKYALKILENKNCPSIFFLNFAPFKKEIFWSGLVIFLCNNYNDFKKIVNPENESYMRGKEFLYALPKHVERFFQHNDKKKIIKASKKYYGEFGTLNDLKKISNSKLFCIGNHLYNHFNALLLNEIDLIKCYNKNRMTYLNNFIDYFSYPYGQKNTCYNDKTNKILIKNGAKAVFTANPLSFNNESKIFHRFSIDESFISERILLAKLNYRGIVNLLS